MRKIINLILFVSFYYCTPGQNVSINNTGSPANPSAMLDVSSTDKGMLVPRMRGSDRLAITSPAEGLLVYDTDTKSFWYCIAGTWKEIPNTNYNMNPGGFALGDLYGTYPAPNVGKIQNLAVAFGVPFDRQVMKWDALNNRWQGLNDSLFLPYDVTSGNPDRLFAITNANTAGGSSAVYGRSGLSGSGFSPGPSVGIWGDNGAGMGIYGTSSSNSGVSGASLSANGVNGLSLGSTAAGVYGNGNGVGVYGETSGGIGVRGSSSFGKAAFFENSNTGNNDTLMKLVHAGKGRGIILSMNNTANNSEAFAISNTGLGQMINLYNSNSANNAHMLFANQTGTGAGFYISVANTLNNSPGILVEHAGTGPAVSSYSYKGKAGLFSIPAIANANTAFTASTAGTGKAGEFLITNTANPASVLAASTAGTGNAAEFTISNTSSSSEAVRITQAGSGRGLESVLTNNANNNAAVYASSPGLYGVYATAKTTAVYGQATGLSGGIAVFGQAGLNNFDGIGVKGASYSDLQNRGAVTGENTANGVGVYGTATGSDGIGVKGTSSSVADARAGVVGVNTAGGYGIYGSCSSAIGTGIAIKGYVDASFAGNGIGVYGATNTGYGVQGTAINSGDGVKGQGGGSGNGVSGFGGSTNGDGVTGVGGGSSGNGVGGYGTSAGNGVYGQSSYGTSGRAALFETPGSGNTYETVKVNNAGLSSSLYLSATNTSNNNTMVRVRKSGTGDYLVCEDGGGINKIRFDNTGKGFFNGGTQTGGADIAEAFDVTGDRDNYEPGDVLVISKEKDRTVEKSSTPYSSMVAGVYATKPGVLMSEENIDSDPGDKVPMGVVGVIPVKVSACNGEIKRGDILVTSPEPGVAMKGDISMVKPGQMIGKALENFNAAGIGKIKVLVNVR